MESAITPSTSDRNIHNTPSNTLGKSVTYKIEKGMSSNVILNFIEGDTQDELHLLNNRMNRKSFADNFVGCTCIIFDFFKNLDYLTVLFSLSLLNIVLYAYFCYAGLIFSNGMIHTLFFCFFSIISLGAAFRHKYYTINFNYFLHSFLVFLVAVSTVILQITNCYTFYHWIAQIYTIKK